MSEHVIDELLQFLDPDPDREGLRETPKRVTAAWNFWTSGYDEDPANILKTFIDGSENYDEMVVQLAIPFYSHCEHHLTIFFGYAHVGYLPNGHIVGLSKLGRLVEIFSRRLTVQERITSQVADALMKHLNAKGAGVVLSARHMCMESRGIQKVGTITTTSALRGVFKEGAARSEFLSYVQTAMQGVKSL